MSYKLLFQSFGLLTLVFLLTSLSAVGDKHMSPINNGSVFLALWLDARAVQSCNLGHARRLCGTNWLPILQVKAGLA